MEMKSSGLARKPNSRYKRIRTIVKVLPIRIFHTAALDFVPLKRRHDARRRQFRENPGFAPGFPGFPRTGLAAISYVFTVLRVSRMHWAQNPTNAGVSSIAIS